MQWSPLAEGRELKLYALVLGSSKPEASPLAEGRELKFSVAQLIVDSVKSPLAEGRELKYALVCCFLRCGISRPSRRGVN